MGSRHGPGNGASRRLKNPNVSTVIWATSKVPQLQENLKGDHGGGKLTPRVWERANEIVRKAVEGFQRAGTPAVDGKTEDKKKFEPKAAN
jgi:hypothetical protein